MNRLLLALAICLTIQVAAPLHLAAASDDEFRAIAAAQQFLMRLDNGEAEQGFDMTAGYHRAIWIKEWWVRYRGGQRAYYGPLVNRALKTIRAATAAPGDPDGDYFSLIFESSFRNKKHADEHVEVVREEDDQWRVSDYSCN